MHENLGKSLVNDLFKAIVDVISPANAPYVGQFVENFVWMRYLSSGVY